MPQCSWMGVEDTQERSGELPLRIKSSLLLLASGQSYLPCTPVIVQTKPLSSLHCSVMSKQGMQVMMKDEVMKGPVSVVTFR